MVRSQTAYIIRVNQVEFYTRSGVLFFFFFFHWLWACCRGDLCISHRGRHLGTVMLLQSRGQACFCRSLMNLGLSVPALRSTTSYSWNCCDRNWAVLKLSVKLPHKRNSFAFTVTRHGLSQIFLRVDWGWILCVKHDALKLMDLLIPVHLIQKTENPKLFSFISVLIQFLPML